MRRYLYTLAIAIFLLACSNQAGPTILPKAKMEKVLWDVAQSGEFLNGFVYYKYPDQNRAALNAAMLERVFKIHKISREQFNATMEFYRKNPNDFKTILDTIINRQKRLNADTSAVPVIKELSVVTRSVNQPPA